MKGKIFFRSRIGSGPANLAQNANIIGVLAVSMFLHQVIQDAVR